MYIYIHTRVCVYLCGYILTLIIATRLQMCHHVLILSDTAILLYILLSVSCPVYPWAHGPRGSQMGLVVTFPRRPAPQQGMNR